MEASVSILNPEDIDSVEELRKRSARTLGFFPYEALTDHLKKRTVLGLKTNTNRLIGYLLFARNAERFRIVHLCVDERYQGQGLARILFDELKRLRTTETDIRLTCRRDFAANKVWPRFGFVPIGEKRGRSQAGHRLTIWQYNLAESDQLGIFRSKVEPEALDVVLDAQVFFDFEEPSRNASEPSKALLADFLVDSLEFWVTDEILVEINRNEDFRERNRQRQRAESHIVPHNQQVAEYYASILGTILPQRTDSQKSDVLHLAKTAASRIGVLVTRDQALLSRSEAIRERVGIRVLSPAEIIVECHQIAEREAYIPSYVSGQDLAWSRVSSEEIPQIGWQAYLRQRESLRSFKQQLLAFAAKPQRYTCEILRLDGERCAVRVIERKRNKLVVHLARTENAVGRLLFERYLATDAMYEALAGSLPIIEIERDALGENLISHVLETGFLEHEGRYFRLCLPASMNRNGLLRQVATLLPNVSANYTTLSADGLEQHCSPADLEDCEKSYLIIPVKPGYAMSLFDRQQAESDLFGGEKSILLRWDNVYYRRMGHRNILKPPARILWYESTPEGKVTTLSSLDDVELGVPGYLLRKYRKLGILKWPELYGMCSGNTDQKLMALKFSNTFPLQNPVPLAAIRDILNSPRLTFQSPRTVTRGEYAKVIQAGFE